MKTKDNYGPYSKHKITIEGADYEQEVTKELKEYQRKSQYARLQARQGALAW